jgi:hypothetical protein
MKKFETLAGGAVWIAVALIMPAAALEPVAAKAPEVEWEMAAQAPCADGSAMLAMGCESIHL